MFSILPGIRHCSQSTEEYLAGKDELYLLLSKSLAFLHRKGESNLGKLENTNVA